MNPVRIVVGLVWSTMALAGGAVAMGLHVNTTESMPMGLWLARNYTGVVRAGDAAVVCLPDTEQTRRYIGHGRCPNGLEPLLKTVGAVAGDTVALEHSGISVNGRSIPSSATLERDTAGRTLTAYPPGAYQVQPGQVWLISTHIARSYDSRYFGPVDASGILAIGEPFWTE